MGRNISTSAPRHWPNPDVGLARELLRLFYSHGNLSAIEKSAIDDLSLSFSTQTIPIVDLLKYLINHGSISHEVADQQHFSSLIAANTNFKAQPAPATRKRLSAQEAMEVTKVRYKETLEYLT